MQILVGLVALILVAAGSFYGGMIIGEQQATASSPGGSELPADARFPPNPAASETGRGQPGVGERFAGRPGMLFGQIDSIDANVLLIANPDGQQTRVEVTDTTLIEKNTSVTVADLTVGEAVMVSGSENSDGSVTARSVQVAPVGRLGGSSQ
jgi:hypothetical protein